MTALGAYMLLASLRDRLATRVMRSAFAEFGSGSTIHLPVRVAGADQIAIGPRVVLGPWSWLGALEPGATVRIGGGTGCSGFLVVSAVREIVIGRDVLFGRNVHVADHRHGLGLEEVPIIRQPVEAIAPVHIEDGAWLGQGVVVLPGVTIGAGAVVGANAVVRDDVPAGQVAAGAPARIVGSRPRGS